MTHEEALRQDINFDIAYMIEMINEKKNFSFSRWGDGEWACILNPSQRKANTDGHRYFHDLSERLENILRSVPAYYIGLQRLAFSQYSGSERFNRLVGMNKWVSNESVHRASIKGHLSDLVKAIETRNVILVGNKHLYKLGIFNRFVQIPLDDCWKSYEKTRKEIESAITKDCVILYCASMMTNVLVDDFANESITQIDCGSVFDPYVGRNIRAYHKNIKHKLT